MNLSSKGQHSTAHIRSAGSQGFEMICGRRIDIDIRYLFQALCD
jgi:hypothetical protein